MIPDIDSYSRYGLQGKCVSLTRGNGEYLRTLSHHLFISSTTTFVCLWYWPTDTVTETIIANSSTNSSSTRNYWQLRKVADGSGGIKLAFSHWFTFSGSATTTDITATLSLGKWNLICIGTAASASAVNISLNAAAYQTITASTNANQFPGCLSIGGEPAAPAGGSNVVVREATTSFCTAYIDDVVVFNAQPSVANLALIYNGEKGRKPHRTAIYKTTAVSHLNFDNSSSYNSIDRTKYFQFKANVFHEEYSSTAYCYLDGVNDYARGVHGTNGFNITRFRVSGDISVNMLFYAPQPLVAGLIVQALFLISQSATVYLFQIIAGEAGSSVTNEIVTVAGANGSTATAWSSITEELSGWCMLTVTASASGYKIYINSVRKDNTTAVTPSTSFANATRIDLGNRNDSLFSEFAFRELAIWKGKELTASEVTSLYNFYTSSGTVIIEDTTATLITNSTFYGDATLIEHWKGLVSNGELIASKRPKSSNATDHHNLTVSGRVMNATDSNNFVRRRGAVIIF